MRKIILSTILFALTIPGLVQGQLVWTAVNGVSATTNWSDTGNWDPGFPPTGFPVRFVSSNAVADVSTINNVVDTSYTIVGVQYAQTNGIHNTLIPAGVSLTATDLTGDPLVVGSETVEEPFQTTNTISGAGAFGINSPARTIVVRQCRTNAAGINRTTMDLSGLDTFTAEVRRLRVGESTSTTFNRAAGTLTLARTNHLVIVDSSTTTSLMVGDSDSNAGDGSVLELGQTNSILTGGITVGRRKQTGGVIRFAPGLLNPTAFFRHTNGVDRVGEIRLGDANTASGSAVASGTMDFTGGTVDILADQIKLGRASTSTTASQFTSRGTLTFDAGLIDVNSLYIGQQSANSYRSAVGELNVNGTAKLVVNTSLFVAYATDGPGITNTAGTLNVNGGTVVAGSILQRSVNGVTCTNTVNFNGGIIIVTNAAGSIGSASLPIQTLSLTNTTLDVAGLPGRIFAETLAVGGSTNVINISHFTNTVTYPFQVALLTYTNVSGNLELVGLGTLPAGHNGYLSNNVAAKSLDLVLINPNPLPSAPTNISYSVSGGDIVVSWPTEYTGWLLERQTNSLSAGLSTNWETVAGSASVSTTNFPLTEAPAQFFRMRKP